MAQHKTAIKAGGTRRSSTKSMKKAGASTKRAASEGVKPLFANSTENPENGPRRKKGTVPEPAGDAEVSLDRRRGSRRDEEPEAVDSPADAGPQLERRKKVNRRRQIDPTTCERDYTDQEVEFMNALDEYKRKSGRMFPTCSEVLEVINGLGYVKLSATELGAMPGDSFAAASAKPMPSDWPASTATAHFDDDESVASAREPQVAS